MKNKKSKISKASPESVNPEREQIEKVKKVLGETGTAGADAERYSTLLSTVKTDIEKFVSEGDVADERAVARIAAKLTQESIIERRLALMAKQAAETETNVDREVEALGRLILGALHDLRRAAVEKAALAMKPHFSDFQECRRKAQSSVEAKEITGQIHNFEHLPLNHVSRELGEKYLEMAPKIFAAVDRARKELGGSIPSDHELQAL